MRFSLHHGLIPAGLSPTSSTPVSSVKEANLIDKTEAYSILNLPLGITRTAWGTSAPAEDWTTALGKPGSFRRAPWGLPPDIGLMEVLLSQAKFISTGVAGLTLWRHIGGR